MIREDTLKSLLTEIGLQKVKRRVGRKGVNIAFCCPFHGERNPSAGVVLDGAHVYGSCFSCKETFSLPKLVGHCLDLSIMDAIDWLSEKFNVNFRDFNVTDKARRYYDDAIQETRKDTGRHELPYIKLAPFRSGKETHRYFFDRGFDRNDAKIHMIGWDRVRKRITIPVFHPDGVLAGFSGRAVLDEFLYDERGRKYKNPSYDNVYGSLPKYLIYDNYPIGEVLYGSHQYRQPPNGKKRAIIVEGLLDRVWMYKMGYADALSIIVAKMSMDRKNGTSTQAMILNRLGVEEVVFMHDNDAAGREGKEVAHEILKDDFLCYDVEYPKEFKDPVGLSQLQIEIMLENKWKYGKTKGRTLRRYE